MDEDSIFLIKEDGGLEKVFKRPYDNEDILQELVENHPDLLAGDQINRENPVRWILVQREAGIPGDESGSGRWSVDHLFLDQNGIPTFVETKRSTDTRIRREVVGQMLDYAANSSKYWPVDRIRTMAAEQYGGEEQLSLSISQLLGVESFSEDDTTIEQYWQQVEDNLRNGRLRLLFVSDRLPGELLRIIEFLNEKMDDVEILGIELPQFTGSNFKAIVPRVFGMTEKIRQTKRTSGPKGPNITLESFIANCPANLADFFRTTVQTAVSKGMEPYWGTTGFSLRSSDSSGKKYTLFYAYPPNSAAGELTHIVGYTGNLESDGLKDQLKQELLAISGTTFHGQFTVNLNLTGDNFDAAEQLLQVIWKWNEIVKGL